MSYTTDEDDQISEQLRQLGVDCVAMIRSEPDKWRSTAEWLRTLPICRGTIETEKTHGNELPEGRRWIKGSEIVKGKWLYFCDGEAEEEKLRGKICRKIICGFHAANYRFYIRMYGDRYIDFCEEDARRFIFLSALIFNKDFDGVEFFEVCWPYDRPSDSTAEREGRGWAWAEVTTAGFCAENTLLKLLEMSFDYLRRIDPKNQFANSPDASHDAADPAATIALDLTSKAILWLFDSLDQSMSIGQVVENLKKEDVDNKLPTSRDTISKYLARLKKNDFLGKQGIHYHITGPGQSRVPESIYGKISR